MFVFSDFGRQLFEIVANYLGATLSELPCKCPEESFGKKTEETFFSLFSDGELKLFWHLAKKVGRFVKTAFVFSTRTFWEKTLTLFSFVWSLNGVSSKFWLITWGKSVGTALYVASGAICRKQVFLGRLIICSLFSDFYREAFGLSAKKSARLSKLHSTSPQEHFKEKIYHVFLGAPTDFFSKFWQKTWGKSVWTALYVARQAIWGKQMVLGMLKFCLFFGFLVESFWLSTKKYRHVCQNCILSWTGKNWGRRFEQFCQCLFFRILGGNFSKL